MTNLYDLMDQYQKVLDSEDDETLVAALEKIEEPIKDKVNNTVSLMKLPNGKIVIYLLL